MLGGGRKKQYSWMDTGGGSAGSLAPSSPGVVGSPMSLGSTNREDEKLREQTIERPGWVTMKDALEARVMVVERPGLVLAGRGGGNPSGKDGLVLRISQSSLT
jgi:hypothetical protein